MLRPAFGFVVLLVLQNPRVPPPARDKLHAGRRRSQVAHTAA